MKSFKKLVIISLIAQGSALYAAQMGTLVTNVLQSAADSFLENPTAHVIGIGAVGYVAGKHIVARRALNSQLEHALTNNGSIEVIEILLKRGAMCSRPLAKALNQFLPEDQLTQRLQLLIDYKADVNEADRFGRIHLQKSAEYGTASSLDELLVAHGTDFNRRAYDYVCVSSFLNKCSARWLLPLLKIVDKNGRTPLMDAARKRGMDMLDLLTSKIPAASINMQDYQGRTALMWSVIEQITPDSFFSVNRDCVKLLLDRGARVDIQDKAGMSVLMHTTNNIINDETLEFLLECAGNQITDSDLENTIKYVKRRIEEYRNHDALLDGLRDQLELLQAEYARRVHSSTAGLSSEEHAKINAKLWRSERSEIARLQALIPRHEESGGGKGKVGAINALIAEFIVGPNPASSDEVAIQEDEKEDAQNGRELFGDFDIPAQRSFAGRAASLGAEPINAGDDGMGLGVVAADGTVRPTG